jgi:wyosine [tRNA(Phe)-imidazoG37] synthetase (radical SAM superfamily)
MRTLKLKKGAIYGPVGSRRLGSSLGINLMPWRYKLCTFNCLYCHFGWTKAHTREVEPHLADLPTVKQVREALEEWLKENQAPIRYLTFSGNGEPCLHPQFENMVDMALETRDKLAPQAKVAILSNSTCLDDEKVRSALKKIEVRIMKLDCGTKEAFERINRPCAGVELEGVVERLTELGDFVLQTVLVDGTSSNSGDEEVERWIEKLRQIGPREVQIYSIDRPSADEGLALVDKERLRRIARRAEEACGIPVKVF